MNGLAVAANETAAEVDVFEIVLFRLEVCDLANVVAVSKLEMTVDGVIRMGTSPDCVEQTPRNVLGRKHPAITVLLVHGFFNRFRGVLLFLVNGSCCPCS